MPSLEKLEHQYKDEDLKILLVNMNETQEQVTSFIKSKNYSSTVLLDSKGKVSTAYSVFGIPVAFLIDRRGAVVFRAVGYLDWSSRKMQSTLDLLIKE